MIQRFRPAADFMRGWETFGHALRMLQTSILRHVVLCLCLGGLAGTGLFAKTLTPACRQALPRYILASAMARGAELAPDLRSARGRPVAAARQMAAYRSLFGGRDVSYLAFQWGARVAGLTLPILALGVWLAAQHGRATLREHRLRGTQVREGRFGQKRSRAPAAWVACMVALSAWATTAGVFHREQLRALPEYLWAGWLQVSPRWACLADPESQGLRAWFGAPLAVGFHPIGEVHAWLKLQVFEGRSVGALGWAWVWRFVGLGACGTLGVLKAPHLGRDLYGRARRSFPRLPAFSMGRDTEGRGANLILAGWPIPPEHECAHFLVAGSPGSGKSTAIKELLQQVRRRGERAIVYDVSGEYVERFYRPGRDIVLNPLDARSAAWDLFVDAREPADFMSIARSLFPSGAREPFWADAASTVFSAAAEVLHQKGRASNAALYDTLTRLPLADLRTLLQDTPAARLLHEDAGPMPLNVMATVTSKVEGWRYLIEPPAFGEPFSIQQYVETEGDGWLFVTVRENRFEALRPLLSMWYDIAAGAILSLPESRSRRIWCALDEVASLQRLPALPRLMARGRKQGAPVILGLQSMAQLRQSYGRDGAAALAASAGTWLVLRTTEPETAQWLESALGQSEQEEAHTSLSLGAEAARAGVGIQRQVHQRSIVLATEIMRLPTLEGYLSLPGDRDIWRVRCRPPAPASAGAPAYEPRPPTMRAAG